eukprot:14125699-Heterocapsa_arctica.AAC.1
MLCEVFLVLRAVLFKGCELSELRARSNEVDFQTMTKTPDMCASLTWRPSPDTPALESKRSITGPPKSVSARRPVYAVSSFGLFLHSNV